MRIRALLYSNSMPLTVHLCPLVPSALLLFLFSITSCLGGRYEECAWDTLPCAHFNFGYPFGKFGSGCGDPDFQLHCPDQSGSGNPLLNISGNEYRILGSMHLEINDHPKPMQIVNNNMFGDKCSLSGNYSQFWSPVSDFRVPDMYANLTLWKPCAQITDPSDGSFYACGDQWLYSFNPPLINWKTPSCNAFQLPILNPSTVDDLHHIDIKTLAKGFEVTWHVDPKRGKICDACLKSNGSCGYDSSNPTKFQCICPDNTSTAHKCSSNGGRKKSIIIGCSIGGAALVAIAAVLFSRFYAKKSIRKQPSAPSPRCSISKVEKFLREYAYEMPTRYSYSQLKKITNNFEEKLGEGGFGVVYKGKLRNGALVAVKLLDRHRRSQTQFMNEVATIGRVHHVNLVRLLGYCFQSHTSALVYEYMVNGSLEKFIFAGKEKGQVLRSEQLYSIALGAARGIAYLHQDCEKRIIHFDIKPHNILLDSEFSPKISDFGLAKLCGKGEAHISMTGARGTPGYVAPEVWSKDLGPVTDKSDVYSFGMLLLEIVGGRKNIDVQVSRSSQLYFPEWAFKLLENGELGMRLRGEGEMEVEDEEKARRLVKIGLWCIQYNYRDRPCMSRVVQMLEGNGDDVSSPPLPFNSSAEPENPVLSSVVTSSTEIEIEIN